MARRRTQPPPFDVMRHLSQLVRHVLPLLVLVAAALFIAFMVWNPTMSDDPTADADAPRRVGLLPVASPQGGDEAPPFDPAFALPRPIDLVRVPVAARFDAPLGSPLGALSYNAQPFLTAGHLGDDLNGIGGDNSDLGDPVHAAADGVAIFSGPAGEGWGNVVTVAHRLPDGRLVETLYGHLEQVRVPAGALVRRGERIGRVGNARGRYLAHLHFEVRSGISPDPGRGYGPLPQGREPAEAFVSAHRGAPEDRQNEPIGGEWDTQLPRPEDPTGADGPSLRIRTVTEPPPPAKP